MNAYIPDGECDEHMAEGGTMLIKISNLDPDKEIDGLNRSIYR